MDNRNQYQITKIVMALLILGIGAGCSRNITIPVSPMAPDKLYTPTDTPVPPTSTNTPQFTSTFSYTPVPPTATFTPSFTWTYTITLTPFPPTATNTPLFTSTFTPTATTTFTPTQESFGTSQGSGAPGNTTQIQGASNVPVEQIVLTNPGSTAATLTSLTLSEGGASASGFSSATLFKNGTAESTVFFSGSSAIFNINDAIPASGGAVTYTAQVDFTAVASPGTYGFSITSAAGTNGQTLLFPGLPVVGATVTMEAATSTNTPTGPTNTPTDTPVPPTATNTLANTSTYTDTPVPPTSTNTPIFSSTFTDTPVPPTATNTPLFSSTFTNTPNPPTMTYTPSYTLTNTFTSSPTITNTVSSTPSNTSTRTFTPSGTPTGTPTSTSTKTATPTATTGSGCAIQGPVFVHPGAWSSCAELTFVKGKIAANAQPWTQQLNNLLGQANGASSGVVFNGITENACTQEGNMQTDSALCYACALYWYLTGNNTYYTKAMNVLGNYATMQGLQSSGCYSGQCQLDGGWFGVCFANACELLRTSPNWTTANTTTYKALFQNAFYPVLNNMCTGNGNIDLTQIDAMMSMAVFCDDQTEWNSAIARYQARMPAYFYSSAWPTISGATNNDPSNAQPAAIAGDTGNGTPFPDAFWYNPQEWIAGLEQETCRDNGHHVQFALDAAVECAEIDYHQGSPAALYTNYKTSLLPASELLAEQFVNNSAEGTCTGTWNPQGQVLVTFEIGYNEYVNRLGLSMPFTSQWLTTLRANSGATANQFNIEWETLTHDGVY